MKIAEIITESFVKPQLDVEWEEAKRYPEFRKIGKEAWIELASKGKAVTITDASDINNTDAADPDSFKTLDPAKQKRAIAQVTSGKVELPVVAVYSDGYKELIGGNTRLTAMMAKQGKGIVWQFEVPDEVAELAENFADGKKKESIEETIRKQGNKYVIYSKDGKKKLGTYDSRKAAEKRLGQIEYFKHAGK